MSTNSASTSSSVRGGPSCGVKDSVVPSVISTSTPHARPFARRRCSARGGGRGSGCRRCRRCCPPRRVHQVAAAPGTSWSTGMQRTVMSPTSTTWPEPSRCQTGSPPGRPKPLAVNASSMSTASVCACTAISGRTQPARPTWSMCGCDTKTCVSAASPTGSPAGRRRRGRPGRRRRAGRGGADAQPVGEFAVRPDPHGHPEQVGPAGNVKADVEQDSVTAIGDHDLARSDDAETTPELETRQRRYTSLVGCDVGPLRSGGTRPGRRPRR